jgi:GntR family transcriptional regulator, rspAB operon transcriptional repressor
MSLDSSDIVQPTMPTLARAETLARQAYAAIRSSIWSGVVSPGVFYSEVQLAGALKISRTPVREALIQLAREGLVEIVPQRGFRLRAISDKERQEAFELRELVEQYVVRRLASEVTDQGVASLRSILDRQAKALDKPEFIDIDEEFHLAMPEMLHLERTREILLTLRGIIWLSGLDALATPFRSSEVLEEHRAVVDALAERDPEKAQAAIRRHVERTRHATAERLRELRGDRSAAADPGPAASDGSRNREEVLVISPEDLQTHGKVDTRNRQR